MVAIATTPLSASVEEATSVSPPPTHVSEPEAKAAEVLTQQQEPQLLEDIITPAVDTPVVEAASPIPEALVALADEAPLGATVVEDMLSDAKAACLAAEKEAVMEVSFQGLWNLGRAVTIILILILLTYLPTLAEWVGIQGLWYLVALMGLANCIYGALLVARADLPSCQASINQGVICTVALGLPTFFAWTGAWRLVNVGLMGCSLVVGLKLISFAQMTSGARNPYLSLQHMVYFIMAPTLCYKSEFPRSATISWRKVASLSAQFMAFTMVGLTLIICIVQPLVSKVLCLYEIGAVSQLFRFFLCLALASTVNWLLFFHTFFNVWLGLLAEVTRYEDRVFYKDWWNATTFRYFW